jgi:ATP-dependent Clp protease protease subunit
MQKEFYLYGEILSDTPAAVADFLTKNQKSEVTIRINSGGGNVFSGLAINNLLKNHGQATVIIDGICGSAATLAAVGAAKVKAAKNSIFMIHNPSVILYGENTYSADELDKLKNSLDSIRNSIIESYISKTKIETAKLSEMLNSATWLSAEDAQELGFIDELTDDEAEISVDDSAKIMFVNKVAIDFSRFKNLPKIAQEGNKLNEESILMEKYKDSVLQAERGRVAALNAMRNDSPAVNSIINKAIENGESVERIKPFIDAVKDLGETKKPPEDTQQTFLNQLAAIIKDNMQSGGEGVEGTATPPMTEDEKKKAEQAAQAELIAQYTNQALKGGVK